MGEIRKDNLHESLIEELNELANIDLSGKQDKTDESLLTESKDVIGAINELFQSANNGKELIANAIGEPLDSNDTFSAMSNDINSLLSTFKTNMMNNGITVESNDKFKSLIDKIATLADTEGKGIQFASGDLGAEITIFDGASSGRYTVETNLSFTPSIIFVSTGIGFVWDNSDRSPHFIDNTFISNLHQIVFVNSSNYAADGRAQIVNITANSFDIEVWSVYTYTTRTLRLVGSGIAPTLKWYAIGVGEEDTTLRDSLASILEEEGVSISEEDDMASLITKVDEEFTNDNNIIGEMEEDIENTRSTLAGLMQEGGYDITGDEDIDSLLDLLVLSGISISGIKQIACGGEHIFILKNDGSVYSCGNNDYGQLGLNDTTNRTTFIQVTTNINNDVKQIACGLYHAFIIKNDGSVWSCGDNSIGQLGLGTIDENVHSTFTKVTTNINNDVEQIACGNAYTFILKNDGSVWGCGNNSKGQLGLNDTTYRTSFTQVTTNINNDVEQIACGWYHTFIIKNDGSVWSCGNNNNGQLGINNTTNKSTFTQVTTNINNDVKQVACGIYHTFILKNDGSVYSCGDNSIGQLGLNNTTDKTTFTKVTTNINNDVKHISCGYEHTFILKNDGSVYSCGYNEYGQLGIGTSDTNAHKTFTQVTTNINNDVKHISCGQDHVFILKNDGSVYSCGDNSSGQLGLGDTTTQSTFTIIPKGFSY